MTRVEAIITGQTSLKTCTNADVWEYRKQNVHICINVNGGLQYLAKCDSAFDSFCIAFFSSLDTKTSDLTEGVL